MNKLFELIVFIVVLAVLWWALTTILAVLGIPEPWSTIAVVVFVVLAVFAFIDSLRAGTWFFMR